MIDALTDTRPLRVIVSEDRLSPVLRDNFGRGQPAALPRVATISADEMRSIVECWRASINRRATIFRKHATGTMEYLPTGCLYDHLDKPAWKRAALACEIFRHPTVSKNCGWLDTRALQAQIAKAVATERPVRLVIGWGQPKRDAAGLKTAGPFADLAETYAIARLGSIARAMAALLSHDVQVTVLSGGTRFRPALFTQTDLCGRYDSQRQRIADNLCGAGTFTFADYEQQLAPGQSQERQIHYCAALKNVSDEMIAAQVNTVLMNVDWYRVFELGAMGETPNGHLLPVTVRDWMTDRSRSDLTQLLRAALCSIVTPRKQAEWQKALGDTEDLIQDTVAFVRAVAWDSARKYIALHEADAVLSRRPKAANDRDTQVRLTVHQKRDRPDIPAIFTLGPTGGDALSQHIVVRLDSTGQPHFEPLAETWTRKAQPVAIQASRKYGSKGLFDWLSESEQPLCYVDAAHRSTVDLINDVLDH